MRCTQAILPVAGLGTRFLPWTKAVPKELLPIGNKPMIALLVDECLNMGITDICLIISPGKEAIPRYFAKSPLLERELLRRGKKDMLADITRYDEVRLTVIYQEEQLGDGHALLQAQDWVQDGVIAVLFGDDFILGEKNGLEQLCEMYELLPHERDFCLLCLEDVARDRVSQYGIVNVDPTWKENSMNNGLTPSLRKIRGLVEKPKPEDAPSTLGIVGRYLIPASLFPFIRGLSTGSNGGEIRLIDALIAAKNVMNIYGHILSGIRVDTGTPAGYRDAVGFLESIAGVLTRQASAQLQEDTAAIPMPSFS